MRWFRRLTGSTYNGKHIDQALRGASAAMAGADAEAGWLAGAYKTVADFAKKNYKVALGAATGLGVLAAAEGVAGADPMVDLGWRLAGNYGNIAELKLYDSANPSAAEDIPKGDVTDELGQMLTENARLYFKDNGGQIVGIIPVDFGTSTYNFGGTGQAIYGNLPWTSDIDEGIELHETPGIIAWLQDTDKFYLGEIVSGRLKDEGFVSEGTDIGVNKIQIDTTNPIPEPSTLALLGVGVGVWALGGRRKEYKVDTPADK